MVAKERRMNGNHLHIRTLRVHVLETLFRRETHFGRGDGTAFPLAHHIPRAVAWLMADAVPRLAGGNGLPETLRYEMGMYVNGAHEHPSCKFFRDPAVSLSSS